MDNRDPRSGVNYLVTVLRRITRIVQLAPFAYLLLLAVYLLGECVLPEWSLRLFDNLLNVPAYAPVGFLFLGRMLKLCSWFRAACLLPFTTRVEGWVDSFVYTFTQGEVVLLNMAVGAAFLVFIYLSFRHFFHGRAEK